MLDRSLIWDLGSILLLTANSTSIAEKRGRRRISNFHSTVIILHTPILESDGQSFFNRELSDRTDAGHRSPDRRPSIIENSNSRFFILNFTASHECMTLSSQDMLRDYARTSKEADYFNYGIIIEHSPLCQGGSGLPH